MFKKLIFFIFVALSARAIILNSKFEFTFLQNQDKISAGVPVSQLASHCKAYIDRKAFDKAIGCYRGELRTDPKSPELNYYLAVAYFYNKNFNSALFYAGTVMNDLPKSPYVNPASRLYSSAKQVLEQKSDLENNYASDYYNELEMRHHWSKMPIRVWIEPNRHMTDLRNAFFTWQGALYPTVSFKMVSNKEDANITVVFGDTAKVCSQSDAIGCNQTWTYTSAKDVIYKTVITLKPNASVNMLYGVLVHEIGHALGMTGHSSNRSDVMYPDTGNYNTRPTRRDVNTVKRIYGK